MKTLATTLVNVQEISENLNAGLALENLRGEYFYVNDSRPRINKNSGANTAIYPPELLREIKLADDEILRSNTPVGYIITSNNEEESSIHLLVKFTINYTTGEPFCFCMLAKKIEDRGQFRNLMEKVKELIPFNMDDGFKFLNHAIC